MMLLPVYICLNVELIDLERSKSSWELLCFVLAGVTEEYYSHHYRSIYFLTEDTDDFGREDEEKRECCV